jgi:hypothetical protein
MPEQILEESNTRFQLSNDGWKRMNAGRNAADLIREAISNTFDADQVHSVKVELLPGLVSIEDDNPCGIPNADLITTVFLTDKSDSHLKRGRKGRGLKELISAAEEAEVDTVGYRVRFADGRQTVASARTSGTKIIVKVAAWDQVEIDKAIGYLQRIVPPESIAFQINGVPIKRRKIRRSFRTTLRTQIVENGIQKDTYAETTVHIVNLAKGETEGWIYEMGIPVQPLKTKFHVDVQQRIPLNDNRDVVDTYYLSTIYACALEQLIDSMSLGALKQPWVQQAQPHHLGSEIKRKIVRKLYGNSKRVVVKSTNSRANDMAKQRGFKIIDISTLPNTLEEVIATTLPNSESLAKQIDEQTKDEMVNNIQYDPTGRMADLIRFLGRHILNAEVQLEFYRRPADFTGTMKVAHFNRSSVTIGFNVDADLPLTKSLDPKILSTICHEFAHYVIENHDEDFTREVERVAGKLSALIVQRHDEILRIVGDYPKSTESSRIIIRCAECAAPREVLPQDVHQVTMCVTCTKKKRRERAKQRKQL